MDKDVLVYEGDKGARLMVKCDGETVWLMQEQMCCKAVVAVNSAMLEFHWNLGKGIPCPPPAGQRRTAAYLDERCAKIDGMIAEAKASIEDCKKRKQSIIFEAVTGKREVA